MAIEEGREPTGSLTHDAGNPSVARGAAGNEGGVARDFDVDDLQKARSADPQGSVEERRETQQVSRSSTDGVGEGLVKDAS